MKEGRPKQCVGVGRCHHDTRRPRTFERLQVRLHRAQVAHQMEGLLLALWDVGLSA
jgi:hypothetical protein